jgi:hypothetical protein
MITRIYGKKDVSYLTLADIDLLIKSDDIAYSEDYGLKCNEESVQLIFSMN